MKHIWPVLVRKSLNWNWNIFKTSKSFRDWCVYLFISQFHLKFSLRQLKLFKDDKHNGKYDGGSAGMPHKAMPAGQAWKQQIVNGQQQLRIR